MQEINDEVLNPVFGLVFFGAVVVPLGVTALVVLQGAWVTRSGQLFLAGTVVYLVGTFLVTMRLHRHTRRKPTASAVGGIRHSIPHPTSNSSPTPPRSVVEYSNR
jgi:hypothetical protein